MRRTTPSGAPSAPLSASEDSPKGGSKGPGLTPGEWRRIVFARSEGRDVFDPREPAEEAHHVVHKNQLKRDGRLDLIWHPLNGIGLTTRRHSRHTLAVERVPLLALPAEVSAWAEGEGYGWYLERTYR